MSSVLSTKKLSPNQKELLLNSGIGLVEMDFISIVPLPYELPSVPQNIIFTSQNAVRIVLEHPDIKELKKRKVFCVGEKTAGLLRKNNFDVVQNAAYGAELAVKIIEQHSKEDFLFFCGRRRNPELEKQLKEQNIPLRTIEVYDTALTPKKIERIFNGILFYSPGGVKSFCELNTLRDTIAFCIGKTTAAEAEEHTRNIVLANKPTIENLIVQVVKKLKT